MNYMKQVAEMLGVELGEEFEIKFRDTKTIGKFELKGLCIKHPNGEFGRNAEWLIEVLKGQAKITKKPWKPKRGDIFCIVNVRGDIRTPIWDDDIYDIANYLMGNCFETKEQAKAHKDEIMAKFQEVLNG